MFLFRTRTIRTPVNTTTPDQNTPNDPATLAQKKFDDVLILYTTMLLDANARLLDTKARLLDTKTWWFR